MKKLSQTPWKALSTKSIYRNPWLSLREDLVELPLLPFLLPRGAVCACFRLGWD